MKPVVMKIKTLSASERKMTAEIIDCIREIELRKIHLEMGYPSVMEFLVRECGYSETAALRRIDAARIVNAIPELRADLQSGSLNLSQVSIVAQSVRQKEKLGEKVSLDKKMELVNAVKNKRAFEVQKIAAQMLDLPVLMAERIVKTRDPNRKVAVSKNVSSDSELKQRNSTDLSLRQKIGVKIDCSNSSTRVSATRVSTTRASTTGVRAKVRRQVFQRDHDCQWVNPESGRKCGSRHLLEIDHKVSKWAGGSDDIENLEVKCRAHNQWKYMKESGIRPTSHSRGQEVGVV